MDAINELVGGLDGVWDAMMSAFGDNIKQSVGVFVLILLIALMMGLADGVFTGTGTADKPLKLVGVLAIAGVCIGNVHSMFGLMSATLAEMDGLSKALLPTLTAATAAAGAPTGALVKNAAIMLFSDVLITVINRFLMPCTYAYLALITADAALGNETLKRMAALLKQGISGVLKLLLTVYVAYLVVSGAISGASDVLIDRSAKLAVSGMVPVVGGIISEATQTVFAGAGVLRNSIGVAGLIAVLTMTVVPFIKTAMNYFLIKLAAALSAPATPSEIIKFIDMLSDVYGLMLGMSAAAALMLLVGIVSCMQTGIGV